MNAFTPEVQTALDSVAKHINTAAIELRLLLAAHSALPRQAATALVEPRRWQVIRLCPICLKPIERKRGNLRTAKSWNRVAVAKARGQ